MASLQAIIIDQIDAVKHERREATAQAFAKALAAGGEFTRYFVPEMHPGDSNDRQLFDMQCEVWRRTRLDVDADAYWIEARKAIALRLQDQGILRESNSGMSIRLFTTFPLVSTAEPVTTFRFAL